MPDTPSRRCGIVDGSTGEACILPVAPGAHLNLCSRHLLEAYDEIAGDTGVTDALPSPCLACGSRLGVRYASGWLCAVCEWRHGEVPDEEAAVLRVDVVYYIARGALIKIGTSSNPRSRLAQIPHDEVLAFERGGRRLEQQRHREFAAARAGREWFERGDSLLAHVESLRSGVDDPWELHLRWRSEAAALAGSRPGAAR